jgi:uncharacterized protein YfdQ (DUF2303 family)
MDDTEAKSMFDLGRAAATAMRDFLTLPDGASLAMVPEGYKIERFSPDLGNHVGARVGFESADSLITYVNKYKDVDGQTMLFASPAAMSVAAVLNYHAAEGGNIEVRHADHVATFKPAFSEQYARWRKIDEVVLSQGDFAEFIEEFARDIIVPAPALMMTVASDLQVKGGQELKSKMNTQSGMVELVFVETGKATTSEGVEVPKQFTLFVPIYFGEEPREIQVFLRFRAIKGGGVHFAIKIQDRDTLEKEAFLSTVARIGHGVGLTPLLGEPNKYDR